MSFEIKAFYCDATPTWSGFNHQGSVGILVTLKKINSLKKGEIQWSDLFIEYEGLEDFSIYENGEYTEIHQVKNYNSSNPSEYKDAIWLLLGKIYTIKTIKKSFLHVTTNVQRYNRDVKFDEEFCKTFFGVYAEPANITVKQRANEYTTSRECFENLNDLTYENKEELFCKVSFYPYNDEKFYCELNEVKVNIFDEIETYLGELSTPHRIEATYNALKVLVEKNVENRHLSMKNEEYVDVGLRESISFEDFIKILDTNTDMISYEGAIIKLKEQAIDSSSDFIEIIGVGNIGVIERINDFINTLTNLNNDDFYKEINELSPHKKYRKDGSIYRNGLPDFDQLSSGLFRIFMEINKKCETDSIVYNIANVTYKPTTITFSDNDLEKNILKRSLFDNFSSDEFFVGDKLINLHINEELNNNDDPNITHISSQPMEHNIVSRRIPTLINIETAKKEINL